MLRKWAIGCAALVAAVIGWNEYRLAGRRSHRPPMQRTASVELTGEEESGWPLTDLTVMIEQTIEPPTAADAESLTVMPRPYTESATEPTLIPELLTVLPRPLPRPHGSHSSECPYHGAGTAPTPHVATSSRDEEQPTVRRVPMGHDHLIRFWLPGPY